MPTTNYPKGVTTAAQADPLGAFILPDFTKAHVYFNDFDTFAAADWTITTTEAGAGSATEAITDGDGGWLLLTNAAGDDDLDFLELTGEGFLAEVGKKMWFEARLKVSDATQSDWVIGLQISDTTILDVTDGIFFQKDDGDTDIDFHVEKNNTATTSTAIATNADDTFIRLGFYYDGVDSVFAFVNGVATDRLAVTNLPDDEEMTVSFGIQNGEAVAKTMTIDYILAAKER